jgi:hypothetical protein
LGEGDGDRDRMSFPSIYFIALYFYFFFFKAIRTDNPEIIPQNGRITNKLLGREQLSKKVFNFIFTK